MKPRGAVFVVVPEARPVTPCTPALVEGREATVGHGSRMTPEQSAKCQSWMASLLGTVVGCALTTGSPRAPRDANAGAILAASTFDSTKRFVGDP